jgi:hypothetical protein
VTIQTLIIGSYEFRHICDIKPIRSADSSLTVFAPQSRYKNERKLALNKYGAGSFCKFTIGNCFQRSGVYVLVVDDQIRYVGECANLSARFNVGYGNISPKNCFKGGQETNCRLNSLIYATAETGKRVALWFFETPDYKRIEATLRFTFELPATEQVAQAQAAAQQETVDLLPELRQGQTRMEQAIQDLSGQGAFLRLQVGQVLDIGNQCTLAAQDQEALREEFRKLQTGGPQRAMAGVYARLFRDLLKVTNQLDELVRLGETGTRQESEKPWIDALRITRDGLEATLVEWGCAMERSPGNMEQGI